MSASSRRTFDTDNITLRQVYARGPQNAPIQSTLVLTADGRGGTKWVHPSSLGVYGLNFISTDVSRIQWDLSLNNVFYLTGGQGAGIQSSVTNPYQAIVYSKAYQAFTDQAGSTMTTLDSTGKVLNSSVKISSSGWLITPKVNSTLQTLFYEQASIQILTQNLSTNDSNFVLGAYDTVAYDNINSTIRFMGFKDIQITTVKTPQTGLIFQISTFTSEGYLDLSGQVSSLRGLSTSVPYSFRSTLTLNSRNSLVAGAYRLSTPYIGTFAFTIGGAGAFTRLVPSTIGYPFVPQGLRGNSIIEQSTFDGTTYDVNEQAANPPYTGDAFLSTLTFSLAPFSTIINRNSNTNIQVQFTPSFLVDYYQSNAASASFLTNVSSYITYADIPVSGTTSQNTFYTINSNLSNQCQMSLNLTIPHTFASNNYTCNYTVYHRFVGAMQGMSNNDPTIWPPLNYNAVRSGFSTTQIRSFTGTTNQATISIVGL
jgi:hypothetical protein